MFPSSLARHIRLSGIKPLPWDFLISFFHPEDAFSHLIDHLSSSDDEVVLAIAPIMILHGWIWWSSSENGRVRDFVIKQNRTDLKYSRFIALWKPAFTRFLKDFTDDHIHRGMDRIRDRGRAYERDLYRRCHHCQHQGRYQNRSRDL